MGLFSAFRKEKGPRIFNIEKKDIDLNKEVFSLMLRVEENLKDLKDSLREGNVIVKDAKLAELENNFLMLKSKVDTLLSDVKLIMDIEVQNKDYITIHDDEYLEDKYNRLNQMSDILEELADLARSKPALDALRNDLINYIYGRVNILVDDVNNIINDDRHLEGLYSKIEYL